MDSMNITDEAIAVIGMSCRFPGAPDLDGYWRNLCEGKVSVTFLDRKDLAAAGVDHGLLRDPNYVPAAYSLGDIDKFDAAFFGYAGSEAEKIDPQQRTFLECAWESLEDAGYTPLPGGGLEGKSVGVFAGSRISAYLEHACRGLKAGNGAEAFQCLVGNDKDYLCSRVSYKLNLNGPSLCVQTACSSSLSAVHVACENLRGGACDMALAGGVAIDVPQEKGYLFQEGMIFSRDGYCRPFDKNASGTVFSGGAGVVVLKRLADALRDRDHIYAVVLASVVNNDGSRRVGYTAPGEFGQTAVIGEAISLSGLSARDIGLVESHGTGTALGDPIEFAALGKAFGHFTQDRGFCALGAVKANIGHADAASGIASFIKAVMAVHTGHIPPHPLFEEANPALDLDASPFYINTALADWKDAERPRAAGISSFGIGGSNAHAVIMQAPEEPVNSRHLPDGTPDLFVLSSRTGTMLRALAGRMARALEAPSASLADICFTARASRSRDKVRLAVRATSTGALREALHAFARGGMPEGMLLSGHTEAQDMPGDLMDDGLQRVALAYMAGDDKALDALQEKALRLGARRVRLPLTPFQRRRFWPEEDSTGTDGTGREAVSHPVWRERFTTAEGKILYGGRLGGKELERMREHQVAGRSIAPGSLLLELLRVAAAREYGADCGLGHVALLRPLPLDGDRDVFFQLILEGDRERGVMELFTSTAPEAPGAWHRTARAGIEGPACSMPAAAPASDEDMPEDIAAYYAAMQGLGVSYGPSFRLLREIRSGRGRARTRVSSGNSNDGWGWDPALLDACLQGVLSCIPQQDRDTDRIFVPAGCRHLDLPEQCPADVQVMLELRESPAGDPGDTGTFLLDVSLFDGNGEAVGRMEGLRMSALPPESVEGEAGSPEAARYAVRWIEGEQLPGRARLDGRWLVLADPGPLAEALAARLESDGCHCRVLSHAERDGLPAALDALADGQGRLHVVDAWPLGVPGMADPDGTYDRSVLPLLEIVRQAQARDMEARLDLVILTSGTFGPDIAAGAHERPLPGQSLVWGLGPVVCMEHPALRVRLMDLQHPEADDTLFRALACEDGEDRQALRDGRRLLPRLERADDGRDDGATGPRALVMEGPGLDNLRWQPLERRSPEAGEVEVAIAASSLNFRDVMMVMGIYPGEETAVGSDGAGIVTAVGDGVSGIQVGDRVAVSAYGCLRTHITLPAAMTCPLPADISFEQAAALPVAYITACYGLEELAGIRAGQTVLIHAASGGVGLAAMAVCRRAGARIFATAGTPAKRELVRSLGAELVMDSRSTAFAQEVLDATGGRGVDIILNSLAGEAQEASFTLVADNGCFVELGKSGLRQAGDYRTERGLMRYRPLDLVELGRDRPDLMAGIFRRAMRGCARGELALLPVTVFAADRHDAAFRHMMQARHTGKIILRWPAAVQTGHPACSGTELVSGGLGGIALRLCADRVRRGCRHLLLLARRQPAAEEAALLEDLRQQGCTVRLALADVSDSSALRHAVDSALKGMPPLKRIWHLAGTLDDDRLLRLDASRFKRVLAPKAEGAWNLHRLSLDHQLEAFVLFSSTASFLGPMGMGNYAAANAFLDELALYRRHLGLPALSINWGAFRDAGMAVRQADLRTLSRLGIHTVAPEEGFAVMERLLSRDECRAAVLHMDWPRYAAGYDSDRLPPLLRSLCPATADDSEASVSPEADSAGRDSRDAVMRAVRAKVATILRTDAASLSGDANLIELGVDSLLALDLFQSLEKQFRIRVDRSLLFKEPTIDALASRIASLLDAGKRAQDGDLPVILPDSAARHEPFPLMGMQQAYWVGRTGALVLGNVSCHVYLELETEDLDLPRWEACWNRLIRHHDMLRCVIMEDGRQRILPEVPPFTVTVQDATGLDAGAAEQMVLECRERMGHEVLSAKEWPLFRVAATRMPGGPIRLHISLDLLVADLHSMNLMMNGLESLYRYPEREPAPLDLSFRDYVLALEAFRKSPRYRKDKEYWLERVAALPPAPDLPLAVPPAQVERPRFVRHAAQLDRKTWADLRQKAAAHELTVSGLLLACYAEVLARWSSRDEFTLNVTLFNRLPLHPEVGEIVGDFTSVSLLACSFDGTASFLRRARALQAQLWADMDHSTFSGVEVIREWSRCTGRSSADIIPIVFTSTIGFGDEHGTHPALRTFGRMVYNITQTPQVWIDHQVREVDDCLEFNWDAVDELFPEGLVDSMFSAYCRLLRMLARDDRIWHQTHLPLLPQEQLGRRRTANATTREFPHAGRGTLDSLFARSLRDAPGALALADGDLCLSYRDLGRAAEALCGRLMARGCGQGSLVAVVSNGGWEEAVAALAVSSAGAAYMPVDAAVPPARLKHLLEYSGAGAVLVQRRHASLPWPAGLPVMVMDEDLLKSNSEFDFERCVSRPDALAYVIHTSGSTGAPKGVMIRHERAVNTIRAVNELSGLRSSDRVLALSRFTFDLSVWDMFGLFGAGGALVLPDPARRLEAAHWLELMHRHQVSIWNSVPPFLQILAAHLEHHPAALPPLRCALLSGDWIPLGLPGRIRAFWPELRLFSLGGATEASIWSNFFPVEDVLPQWKSIPYGKPLANQRFFILDRHGSDCPDWVPGELHIAGDGLADGYLKDPERTAERFIRHPGTGEDLYATGDLGCYMPDGNIEFLGRQDNQVKINGYRVELGEVENTLMEHPFVEQAAALTVRGRQAGQVLAAFVACRPGTSPAPEELQQWLAERLPSFLVPGMILMRESLPLTSSGKVDRKSLVLDPDQELPRMKGAQPGSETERLVAGAIAHVLGCDDMSIDSRFFEMGLSSLDLVAVQAALGERLGTDIPLMTLLEHTSIRALAAWLDNRTPRTTAQEISAPEGGGSASAFDRGMDRAERRMRTRSRQRTGR